ncbi:hypothetical protein D3C78_1268590 [compost metagenome]
MHRPRHLGQLTLDQRLGQVIETATADFLGHVERIKACGDGLATNLRGQLRRHLVGAVHGLLMGQQLFGDETAYRFHQHFLFLGQLEIHGMFLKKVV